MTTNFTLWENSPRTSKVSWLDLAAEPCTIGPKSQTALDQRSLDVVKINLRRAQRSLDKEFDLAMAASSKAQHCAEKPASHHDTELHGGRETVNQSTAPTADNGQTASRPGDEHERDTDGGILSNAQATYGQCGPPKDPACDTPRT